MSTDPLKDACKGHIRAKRCTLWMVWDVSDEEGLDAAASWLADEVRQVVSDTIGPARLPG